MWFEGGFDGIDFKPVNLHVDVLCFQTEDGIPHAPAHQQGSAASAF
jgi:hypothetical protein